MAAAELAPQSLPRRSNILAVPVLSLRSTEISKNAQAALAKTSIRSKTADSFNAMRNLEKIKKRFLKEDLAARLGGIASNLARLESFSRMPNNKKVIQDLIEESKFLIEWTAPQASLDIQEELVKLQVQLALWEYSRKTKGIVEYADKSAKKILKLSGLLERA